LTGLILYHFIFESCAAGARMACRRLDWYDAKVRDVEWHAGCGPTAACCGNLLNFDNVIASALKMFPHQRCAAFTTPHCTKNHPLSDEKTF
jgi:hypothetical protein